MFLNIEYINITHYKGTIATNGGDCNSPGGGAGGGGLISVEYSNQSHLFGEITSYGGRGAFAGAAGIIHLRYKSSHTKV